MPSRRRKTKYRKKRWTKPIEPAPWLWAAFVLDLAIGLIFSPATSLHTLRVTGSRPYDRERLGQIAQSTKGVPALRLDRNSVQSSVLQNLAVERVEFRANLFGRGVLDVVYRTPVARIEGADGLYLSDTGVVFPSPAVLPLKGKVSPPTGVRGENLSVFGAWRSGATAKMCDNIRRRLPDLEWRLVVEQAGYVSLELAEGGVVEFVSFDDTEKKVAKLAQVLRDDPKLFERAKRLNLSSPMKPTFAP